MVATRHTFQLDLDDQKIGLICTTLGLMIRNGSMSSLSRPSPTKYQASKKGQKSPSFPILLDVHEETSHNLLLFLDGKNPPSFAALTLKRIIDLPKKSR